MFLILTDLLTNDGGSAEASVAPVVLPSTVKFSSEAFFSGEEANIVSMDLNPFIKSPSSFSGYKEEYLDIILSSNQPQVTKKSSLTLLV